MSVNILPIDSKHLDTGGQLYYMVESEYDVEYISTDKETRNVYQLFLSKDTCIIERAALINSLSVVHKRYVTPKETLIHELRLEAPYTTSLRQENPFVTYLCLVPYNDLLIKSIKHQLQCKYFDCKQYPALSVFDLDFKYAHIKVNPLALLKSPEPIVVIVEYKHTFKHKYPGVESPEVRYIPSSMLQKTMNDICNLYAKIIEDLHTRVIKKRNYRFIE